MANKFLFFMFLLSACGNSINQKVELNYDLKYVSVESQMYFIEKIKIFNSVGNSLYELNLNSDEVGLNKVFLFQDNYQYSKQGSLGSIKSDTLNKHIEVEIHSRNMKEIKTFERRFNYEDNGVKIIQPIKEPFP